MQTSPIEILHGNFWLLAPSLLVTFRALEVSVFAVERITRHLMVKFFDFPMRLIMALSAIAVSKFGRQSGLMKILVTDEALALQEIRPLVFERVFFLVDQVTVIARQLLMFALELETSVGVVIKFEFSLPILHPVTDVAVRFRVFAYEEVGIILAMAAFA